MNTKLILAGATLLVASAFTAQAQTHSDTTTTTTSSRTTSDLYSVQKGDWEFTLGGSGSSNKDFDNSLGGVSFSIGQYLTDTLSLSLRQTTSYSNGSGNAEFDASSFLALDYHFGHDRLRPFVGVNLGYLYGENTTDTWAAGLEAGLKYYVKPQTFLFALVNYAWTFDDSSAAQDNFDDGAFLWNVGVGFNF